MTTTRLGSSAKAQRTSICGSDSRVRAMKPSSDIAGFAITVPMLTTSSAIRGPLLGSPLLGSLLRMNQPGDTNAAIWQSDEIAAAWAAAAPAQHRDTGRLLRRDGGRGRA